MVEYLTDFTILLLATIKECSMEFAIVAFEKVPRNKRETHKFLFGGRKWMLNKEDSKPWKKPDSERDIDIDTEDPNNPGSYFDVIDVKVLAEILFEELFCKKGRKQHQVNRDEASKIFRSYPFPGRPLLKDYKIAYDCTDNIFDIDWKKYFKAEKKAADKYVDSFMNKHKGCSFFLVSTEDLSICRFYMTFEEAMEKSPFLKIC